MLIPQTTKIYFYLPPTDMRKSIDSLSILIVDVLNMNQPAAIYFCFAAAKVISSKHYIMNRIASHCGIADSKKANLFFLKIRKGK